MVSAAGGKADVERKLVGDLELMSMQVPDEAGNAPNPDTEHNYSRAVRNGR